MKKHLISATAALLALSAHASADAQFSPSESDKKCKVDVQKDTGENFKICDDGVSFGGPIKDVTWATPLGGENAAIPKAAEDINKALGEPIKDVTLATPLGGENAAIPKATEQVKEFLRKPFG